MLFFFPFLQVSFKNDKYFAELLCDEGKGRASVKTKEAAKEFLNLYSDELYYVSSKFNNKGIPMESWQYRMKSGRTINVTDEVSDTFVWLFRQAFIKSCSYRGENAATFKTYINTILNSDFTFKDWLKWKTKVTGYIPTCIKKLDNDCQKIYKLMQQGKDDDAIQKKMEIEYDDFINMKIIVENTLINSGQMSLIRKPKIIHLDQSSPKDDDDNREIQLPSGHKTELQPDVEVVKQMAGTIIEHLSDAERRLILLYWKENKKVKEIFDIMSFGRFTQYLIELNIKEYKDIYLAIDKIVKESLRIINDNYPEIINELLLDESKIKKLLKVYFLYFDKNK